MAVENREWQKRAVVAAALLAMGTPAHASSLVPLATFNGAGNGASPKDGLVTDAAGNLFGTTSTGGSGGSGTVFEIVKTGTNTYAAPITIASFAGTSNGGTPLGGLVVDANGNLFGTTSGGGSKGDGTVFEIAKTGSSYGTVNTIATFSGTSGTTLGSTPDASLTIDAAGNLYGTTSAGGSDGQGTVFEIAKTGSTFASPTILATFTGANGGGPYGGLVADASGDLFGTASYGGANGDGSVFELAKSASTYTLKTLVSFNSTNGQTPDDTLLIDSVGNLFGTTYNGGSGGEGTIFELNSSNNYALTTLINLNYQTGENPYAGLVANIGGVLYGTTVNGGTSSDGTVFALAPSSSSGTGYGSLTTLVNFNGTNGKNPYGSVIVDSFGDLFGTTKGGGTYSDGTVFEYAVPEPSTLALIGTTLLAGITLRRRRPLSSTARLVGRSA
jgi:uncharacterized repeat protein (TIGR03803 family)